MTKKELAHSIAAELQISQTLACEVVQRLFDKMVHAVVTNGRLELRNFGVFEIHRRAARRARNPRTNQGMAVPEKLTICFKPGKEMADRLASLPDEGPCRGSGTDGSE